MKDMYEMPQVTVVEMEIQGSLMVGTSGGEGEDI